MMTRAFIFLIVVLGMVVLPLSACGRKIPLERPTTVPAQPSATPTAPNEAPSKAEPH